MYMHHAPDRFCCYGNISLLMDNSLHLSESRYIIINVNYEHDEADTDMTMTHINHCDLVQIKVKFVVQLHVHDKCNHFSDSMYMYIVHTCTCTEC